MLRSRGSGARLSSSASSASDTSIGSVFEEGGAVGGAEERDPDDPDFSDGEEEEEPSYLPAVSDYPDSLQQLMFWRNLETRFLEAKVMRFFEPGCHSVLKPTILCKIIKFVKVVLLFVCGNYWYTLLSAGDPGQEA